MTEREKFEAWYTERYTSYLPKTGGGEYCNLDTLLAWKSWQAARATPADHSVPEGWKLVPAELTDEMRKAANEHDQSMFRPTWASTYRAMLAAAPQAERKVSNADHISQARDAVIEQCAKEADEWAGAYRIMATGENSGASDHREGAALEIAASIRALKSAPPEKPAGDVSDI